MKLKLILEKMDQMPSTLKGFNETPKLSPEKKRRLMEMVNRYNEFGQKLKMENSLIETAQALAEISELAETYACNEAQDWFATEVVKEDFKRARGISETFQKIARECHGKVQKLNALYEDMGHILERYYEIADPMQEVVVNPADIQSQRPLPNANPQCVQEVKPNTSNLKSQHCLPAGGPAPKQIKEVAPNDKNIKSQRELPHKNGPASPQLKETTDEATPPGWEKTVKGMKKHSEIDNPWALTNYMKNQGYKSRKEEVVNEVAPNTSNLQSQRELPQAGSANNCGCLPKPEAKSVPVKPAGAGEMNVKGERDVPQGGPAQKQIKEVAPNTSNLQSQRKLPANGNTTTMK